MEGIKTFFKEHGKIILVGISGVILGVLLNNLVDYYKNKKLLASLENGLKELQDKAQLSALTKEEDSLIQYLQGEIYILKFKCT